MRCLFSFFAEAALVVLEFLGSSCGHGDAGGSWLCTCAAAELLCWFKNGAWRVPCDDPYLAKTVDSHIAFCQIWFASRERMETTLLVFTGLLVKMVGCGRHEFMGNTICNFFL